MGIQTNSIGTMFRLVIFSCLFLATFANSTRRPTQQRIVGGRKADIRGVPHQVAVRYENNHECGGTIIGPKHILTAAHCVEKKNPSRFSIRAGSNYYLRGGEKIDVVRIRSHPNYNTDTVDYDAAVLTLKQPLTLSDRIKPVPLTDVEPKEGETVLISGWGAMKKDGMLSDDLLYTTVTVVSRTLCQQKYADEGDEITDRMFCAGHPKGGKDACEGDSGGPAIINGKLAGIVSWGDDCGIGKRPGVYTNIFKILDWISTQIR